MASLGDHKNKGGAAGPQAVAPKRSMAQTSKTGPQAGNGVDPAVIARQFQQYQSDPNGLAPDWKAFFDDLDDEARGLIRGLTVPAPQPAGDVSAEQIRSATLDSIRALMLIRAYRVRGHLEADLDPLGLTPKVPHPELDPKTYGFTDADMERPIFIDHVLGLETATLIEIVETVRKTYCGKIGVEYMHIQDPAQKAWIQERIESIHNETQFTDIGKRAILERLTAAEVFEKFLNKKYTGTKRFGLDGGEAMIPALEQILKRGGQLGLKDVVIGMPHRGRLNVLANFMGKPFTAIFSEFQGGAASPEDVGGSGDVKYHLGTSTDREFDGQTYVLEPAIRGDFALVKAWKADEFGNLVFRKTARNFNPMMATAAAFTIAEVEQVVPTGEIDADAVHTPGAYIDRIVQTVSEKRIEQRTVSPG